MERDVPHEDDLSRQNFKSKWGWCNYRPNCFQTLNKPIWALLFISAGIFLQSFIINGLLHIDLPLIERRFNLNSKQAGFICSSYDITSVTLLIPFTYFGGQRGASKPLWYGSGLILMGIGSFVFFTPELLVSLIGNSAGFTNQRTLLCNDISMKAVGDVCDVEMTKPSHGFWVFLLANLICGAGGCTLYTLGITYLEESVTKEKSASYIGVFYITAIIGPAVGFVVGGYFLNIDNTYFFPDPVIYNSTMNNIRSLISYDDASYVGAWWLGFIICSILFFIVAIPVFGFPAELPDTPKIRASKIAETHGGGVLQEEFVSLKDIPRAVYNLIKNPPFMFLTLAGCCDSSVINTTSVFMPKILENQFYLVHEKAAISIGLMVLIGGICGIIAGGGVLSYFDLNCTQTIKFCIYACIVSTMFMAGFHIHCSAKPFAGVNVYYTNSSTMELTSNCNKHCNCYEEIYSPVCGNDNITYYSACYAGCLNYTTDIGYYVIDDFFNL